jgi:hypothetical protein
MTVTGCGERLAGTHVAENLESRSTRGSGCVNDA